MEYIPPLGGAPNESYRDPNPLTGERGSIIPAAAFEDVQRELVHLLEFASIPPSAADLTQVRQAVQNLVADGLLNYVGLIPLLQLSAAQVVSGVMALARLPVGLTPRNRIWNGGMQVWQRGLSIAMDNTTRYAADRWGGILNSGSGVTISRASDVGAGFPYAMRIQRNAGTSNTSVFSLAQAFPSAESIELAGKTVTLSFYARAGANFSSPGLGIGTGLRYSVGGTDQSLNGLFFFGWTGTADLPGQGFSLTPTLQRFSRQFVIPANATQIGIYFATAWTGTAGANDWWDLTGVQLHVGDVPLDYAHQRFSDELLECQRFYANTFNHGITPGGNQGFAGAIAGVGNPATTRDVNVNWFYPVEMRAVPAISTYNPGGGLAGYWRFEGNNGDELPEVLYVGRRAAAIASNNNVGSGQRIFIHAAANAEL